jgi:hypothetical protein
LLVYLLIHIYQKEKIAPKHNTLQEKERKQNEKETKGDLLNEILHHNFFHSKDKKFQDELAT